MKTSPDINDALRDEGEGAVRARHDRAHIHRRTGTLTALSPIQATLYSWCEPTELPTRAFLYERHIARQYVSATIGNSGVGKTSNAIVEAISLSSGKGLLTGRDAQPLRVWYINLEDPLEELKRRFQAAFLHYGVGPDDIAGRLFVDSGRDIEIVGQGMVARKNKIIIARESPGTVVRETRVIDEIKNTIAKNKLDVVFVDPFKGCHRVNENDNNKIDDVVSIWGEIAAEHSCGIELEHHARKLNGTGDLTVEDARGANALIAAVRSARVLNVMTKKEAEDAGVEDRWRYLRFDDGKKNLTRRSERSTWVKIESVSLGNGGGKSDDEVGVITHWRWPDPFNNVSSEQAREVQKRLAGGKYRADQRAHDWAGKVIEEVLGWNCSSPSVKRKINKLLQCWIKSGALRKVSGKNLSRKKCDFIDVGVPIS